MTVAQLPKSNFSAGEVTPRVYSKYEYRLNANGLAKCEHMVSLDAGGATRRPPTEYVYPAYPASILIPHEIGRLDSFMIEHGHLKARFFRNAAILLSGGTPYEVTTPYQSGDLALLRWQTDGDAVYLTHPVRGLWKLLRNGNVAWSSALFALKGGPFLDENTDESKKIAVTAREGTVTLKASGFTFAASLVGSRLKLRDGDQRVIEAWEPEIEFDPPKLVSNDGKVYENMGPNNDAGINPPTHEEGEWLSGRNRCLWKFRRFNYGIVKITAVAGGGATATGTVETILPEEFSEEFDTTHGANDEYPDGGSWRWAEEAFSEAKGWPDEVIIQDQRLYLLKGNRGYASVVAAFNDFTTGRTPEKSFSFILGATTGKANDACWAMPGKVMLIGTSGEEFSLQGATLREGVSATSKRIAPATSTGSIKAKPIRAFGNTLHIGADGRSLWEIVYDFSIDDFRATSRSLASEHITAPAIDKLVWQRDPRKIAWGRRTDGVLLGFTYNPNEEVMGWHRHPLPNCAVGDSGVIPSPDGKQEDLWLITTRTINGAPQRMIERLLPYYDPATVIDPSRPAYLDCQRIYEGAAVSTIGGLSHFANHEVSVVSNYGYEGKFTVNGAGQITLPHAVTYAVVGLGYRSWMRLLPPKIPVPDGTPEGKVALIKFVAMRARGAPGVLVGNIDKPDLAEEAFLSPGVLDTPPGLMSQVKTLDVACDWNEDSFLDIWTDNPFPLDILSFEPVVEWGDG